MTKRRRELPIALTIAGSDSGGGAGIQADLKTFASLGVHGTSTITCLTAQNPKRVAGIQACNPKMVQQQIEAVFQELPPEAVKTGMIYSTEIINVIIGFFRSGRRPPLVVDPVMISTSGAKLLKDSAIRRLINDLFPLATLLTPNLDEAELILNTRLKSVEDLRAAAKEIHARFGCAALVKGGHLRTGDEAIDIFFDGKTELLLSAPFVKGVHTHGTGCTYSAAIAGYLALGQQLAKAVESGKHYITGAIAGSEVIAKHTALNHFHKKA